MPYPGAPLNSDAQIVARPQDSNSDLALLSLKGELASMGVLDSDEGLRRGDLEALSALWSKLRSLGRRAQKNGQVFSFRLKVDSDIRVKLLIDAEHSWYQPSLDAYTLLLSEEFNKPPTDGSTWRGPLI